MRANRGEMCRLNVQCGLTFGIGRAMPTGALARTKGVTSTVGNRPKSKRVRVTRVAEQFRHGPYRQLRVATWRRVWSQWDDRPVRVGYSAVREEGGLIQEDLFTEC